MGGSISIRDLAERIREIAGAESEIVHGPSREGDIRHSVADIDRARSALGFEPTVETGADLERTIEWFRTTWREMGNLIRGRERQFRQRKHRCRDRAISELA